MRWFRMSLGDGKRPPVEWWKAKTTTEKGKPRDGWPEVLNHVFFRNKPKKIQAAYADGGARLIYYCSGGGKHVVAVADVIGPPEKTNFKGFVYRVPVKLVGPKCRCDATAPVFPLHVPPGSFAELPAGVGPALAAAISKACGRSGCILQCRSSGNDSTA